MHFLERKPPLFYLLELQLSTFFSAKSMGLGVTYASSTHKFGAMRSDCLVQFSILYRFSEPYELRFRSGILHQGVGSHA